MNLMVVGSSIMAMWSTMAEDLAPDHAANGAIGGTTAHQWRDWVAGSLQIPCDGLVVYAGSNDLSFGRSGDEIIADLVALRDRVAELRPGLPVAYLSIMAVPQKAGAHDLIDRINAAVCGRLLPGDLYVDINARMRTADGSDPRFLPDGLHLTEAGYADLAACVAPRTRLWSAARPGRHPEGTRP